MASAHQVRQNGPIVRPHHLHRRTYELLYRCSSILWAAVAERDDVRSRRRKTSPHAVAYACSADEGRRVDDDALGVVEWLADRWCRLCDAYLSGGAEFAFDDAYAVLFFVRILYPNNVVIARGHYDARWRLSTTYERAEAAGTLQRDLRAAEVFIQKVLASEEVRNCYTGEIPPKHLLAMQQHYGFPTALLDFTYSLDVAIFFAEGGGDYLRDDAITPSLGAVYVIPSWACVDALLTTLPPGIMRPSLQRGVFIETSPDQRAALEAHKYVFRHQDMPVRNGLLDVHFGAAVGLGRYLFPASDPLERLAVSADELYS